MMSDASASESGKQDSGAINLAGDEPQPSRIGPREAAMRALRLYNRTFLRVAHTNEAQANLMKSSATKLTESLKLLAEINDLLRR
jgi:hypothetical protein